MLPYMKGFLHFLFSASLVLNLIQMPCLCVVSGWGEFCNFTDECSDHRLVCKQDHQTISRCVCDRFHEWRGAAKGCVQLFDAETILNMTMVSHDNKGQLEKDTASIFVGQKVAGFFVMSVALLCPLIIAVHCFHMRRKDRALKREVDEIRQRVDKTNRDKVHTYASLA